jgi:streptogramin lyase
MRKRLEHHTPSEGHAFTHAVNVALTIQVLAVLALTGCGTSLAPSTGTKSTPYARVSGHMHGGQQPISGSNLQIMAMGTTANGSAATSLMNPGVTVTTDSYGDFDLDNTYTCPAATPNAQVYLLATGGNPGINGSVNNTALTMLAPLGPCAVLVANAANTFISLDEVTTVATVYALAGFMADAQHIGSAPAYATGLANGVNLVNALVSIASGSTPGTIASNATVPSSEIDTLASIIATCVNTGSNTSPACANLFSAATPAGGTAPTDTVTALLNIAKNPASKVTPIFNLTGAIAPYQPVLTTAPKDWTMAVKYTGAGFSLPTGVAIDATGNAWFANQGSNAITKIAPDGTLLSTYTNAGFLGAQAIAVDQSGDLWVAGTAQNTVLQLTSAGAVANTLTGSGLNGPASIAIDPRGYAWVANLNGNSVTAITGGLASGTGLSALSGSPFTAGGTLANPSGIAVDGSGNVWVGNTGAHVVAELSSAGATLSGAGDTDGLLLAPYGIAIGPSGSVLATSPAINAVTALSSTGAAAAFSPASGAGLSTPTSIAVDGAGIVWAANSASLSALSATTGTAVTTTGLGTLASPYGLAIDATGNVWVAGTGDNSVSQFVGLATPILTPIVNSH